VAGLASPILIIDSSLAGMTIVRALRDRLPNERLVFFGDLARAPYTHRSPERVCLFVEQIIRRVERVKPKYVLLACDVAGTVAVTQLRQRLGDIPVTSTIDPAARAAVEAAGDGERPTIGIFANNWSIEKRAIERAIFRRRTKCQLFMRTAPALEAIVNEGRSVEDPLLVLAAGQYLNQLLDRGCEVILLASTAVASLRRTIQSMAGDDVRVVDASRATADDVARRLGRLRLLRPPQLAAPARPIEWFLTDESPELFDRAERLAGLELPPPTIVGLDELDAAMPIDPRMRSTA
jgi:glutamate racemase